MTYEERLERNEREFARIAEKQTRLYKWIAGITVAAVACFGYAALTNFNPALPAAITTRYDDRRAQRSRYGWLDARTI